MIKPTMLHLLSVVLNLASPAAEQHEELPLGDEEKAADLEHSFLQKFTKRHREGQGTSGLGEGRHQA